MSTVNFNIPAEIKSRFNKVFAHEDKSQLIAQLMKQAIEEHERQLQRVHAINALLKLRSKQKPVLDKVIRKARQAGRP